MKRFLLLLPLIALGLLAEAAEHWDIYQPGSVPWADAKAIASFNGKIYVAGSGTSSIDVGKPPPGSHPGPGLWRSGDGQAWEEITFPGMATIVNFAELNGKLYAACHTDVGISTTVPPRPVFSSSDGTNWQQEGSPAGAGFWSDFIAYQGALYLGGYDNLVVRGVPSGTSVAWSVAGPPFSPQAAGNTPVVFSILNGNLIAAANFTSPSLNFAHLYKTTNGISWTNLTASALTDTFRTGFVEKENRLYLAANGLRTVDSDGSSNPSIVGNLPVPFVLNDQLHVFGPSSQILAVNSQNEWGSVFNQTPSFCQTVYPRYGLSAQLGNETYILPCALMKIRSGAYRATLVNSLANPVSANQQNIMLLMWDSQINFQDTLRGLTVKNIGTAVAGHDLSNVSLYQTDGLISTKVVEMAAGPDGKTWTLPAPIQINLHDGDRLFVSADIQASATPQSTCQFSIPLNGFIWTVNPGFQLPSALTAPQSQVIINNGPSQAPALSNLDKVIPYPVPAKETIRLTYTLLVPSDVETEVMDRSGARIAHLQESGKAADPRAVTVVDSSSFPSGIYFVRTTIHGSDGSKKIYKSKLIVEK